MNAADVWAMLTAHASFGDGLLTRCRFTPAWEGTGAIEELPEHARSTQWVERRIDKAREFGYMVDPRTQENFSDVLVSPVPRRENGQWGSSGVLWARLDTGPQYKALGGMGKGPTCVIRAGGSVQRYALWALAAPLDLKWCEKANRRISYRLDTARKWATPESGLLVPVPGTTLRYGREKRPLEVVVEYADVARVYKARDVVGSLKDPPAPNTEWRERTAA